MINKQGYGLDRKGTWKRGNRQYIQKKQEALIKTVLSLLWRIQQFSFV